MTTQEYSLRYVDGTEDPYALLDYDLAAALATYHEGARVYGRQRHADGTATAWAEVIR